MKKNNTDETIIYTKNGNLYASDYTGKCKTILRSTGRTLKASRSRNGELVAFTELSDTNKNNKYATNLLIMDMQTHQITKINTQPVDPSIMYWSPDNRFLVYKEDGKITLYFYHLRKYIATKESAEKIYITNASTILMVKNNILTEKTNIIIYNNNGELIKSLSLNGTDETYTPLYWNQTNKTLLGYTENKEGLITGFMKDGIENYPLKPYGLTSCKNDPAGDLNPFPQGICGATSASLTTNLSHLLIAKNNLRKNNQARILLYDLKRNTYKEIKGFNNVFNVSKIKWNTYNSAFVLNTLPDNKGTRYVYAYDINKQTIYTIDIPERHEEVIINTDTQLHFSTGYDY